METIIKLNQEDAIKQAKINCIRQFENEFEEQVSDKSFLTNEHIWLIKTNKSCKCVCGESNAVEAILFTKFMNSEMCEYVVTEKDLQFSSLVGYCENCGE